MKSLYWKLPPRSFMVERCQCLLSTLQRTGWLSFRGYCNRWLKKLKPKLITTLKTFQFSSVSQLVSDSSRSHELQHARPPCPSPTPGVYSNSCPSSRWCHPAISSSVIPFSSCPQSLPASGSFSMSQLFTWGGQSIGVSASSSVLQWTPKTDLFKDGLVGSPCSPRDSQESSTTPQFKSINSSALNFLQSHSHIHTWPLEKP